MENFSGIISIVVKMLLIYGAAHVLLTWLGNLFESKGPIGDFLQIVVFFIRKISLIIIIILAVGFAFFL